MMENDPETSDESPMNRLERLAWGIGRIAAAAFVGFVVTGSMAASEVFPRGIPTILGLAAGVGTYIFTGKFLHNR